MDAECKEAKRNRYLKSRKQRWSMNSQRLEEIVAELMRPIGDLRRNFDTDLSALLEEYLTEAGLHALDACDGEDDEGEYGPLHAHTTPNFSELALLLQNSASIYGRKVDFLYQHVLSVSDSLQNTSLEITNQCTEGEAPGTTVETQSRRRAAAAPGSEWAAIELEPSSAASRASEPPRPPPTLPRAYIELEPRVLAPSDAPLTDYAGDPVGLLQDFHVTWRLHLNLMFAELVNCTLRSSQDRLCIVWGSQEGMLVEELEGGAPSGTSLRAIPLTELQAALSARAPPLPPATPPPPSPPPSPPPTHASTPLPLAMLDTFDATNIQMPPPGQPDSCRRKRKRDSQPDDLPARIQLLIGKELRRELRREKEFSIPVVWVRDEVRRRSKRVLALRRRCASPPLPEFRGFEYASCDADGFRGWSCAEAVTATEAAHETATEAATLLADPYSDDDGFFEQSCSGDSTGDEPSQQMHNSSGDSGVEWWSWQAGVAARAAAEEARGGVDVRALARRVLATLPAPPATASCAHVMTAAGKEPTDVSRLFLATLFLANAGNVEVVQGAPLTTDSFALRLLSTDERLYGAAAARDAALLRPPAATAAAARTSSSVSVSARRTTSDVHVSGTAHNADAVR